jgi:hypothetical protein
MTKYGPLILIFASLTCSFAWAKRIPPRPVPPVTDRGIEYKAEGDGTRAWIVATDTATKTQLWAVKVFRIHTHWWKGEEDNQWVFISFLQLDNTGFFIKDERSRCYHLNLETKRLHSESCH